MRKVTFFFLLIISIQAVAQGKSFKWVLLDNFEMDSSMNYASFNNTKYLDNVLEVKISCAKGSVTLGRMLLSSKGKISLIDLNKPITPGNDLDITDWYGDKVRPTCLSFSHAISNESKSSLLLLAKVRTY